MGIERERVWAKHLSQTWLYFRTSATSSLFRHKFRVKRVKDRHTRDFSDVETWSQRNILVLLVSVQRTPTTLVSTVFINISRILSLVVP